MQHHPVNRMSLQGNHGAVLANPSLLVVQAQRIYFLNTFRVNDREKIFYVVALQRLAKVHIGPVVYVAEHSNVHCVGCHAAGLVLTGGALGCGCGSKVSAMISWLILLRHEHLR